MTIKLKVLQAINWTNYTNWCKDNEFKKDNFRSLELFINDHKSEEWNKLLRG